MTLEMLKTIAYIVTARPGPKFVSDFCASYVKKFQLKASSRVSEEKEKKHLSPRRNLKLEPAGFGDDSDDPSRV